MNYIDKFFNSTTGRLLSAITVIWTLFEIFKHFKQNKIQPRQTTKQILHFL
jgi:hypothetical protein